MSLIDDLREAADNLVPSHTVEINKIQGVVSSIVHYIEDPEGFINALHSEEGAAAGLLAHFTAAADNVNQKAQRDVALASGLTNVPTYQELLDVFKNAIQTGTLPPAEPVAPPVSGVPVQPTTPGAPPPAATNVPVDPPASTVPSNIPGAPPITVVTANPSPAATPDGTGVPVVPNSSATNAGAVPAADVATGQPAAPAFQGQPTYEQLMATVTAQQQALAASEQALTASQAAAAGGAVQAGNQATAEQAPAVPGAGA